MLHSKHPITIQIIPFSYISNVYFYYIVKIYIFRIRLKDLFGRDSDVSLGVKFTEIFTHTYSENQIKQHIAKQRVDSMYNLYLYIPYGKL